MLSTAEWDRRWSLTIDDIALTEMDFSFKVHRSLKSEPNTCSVIVYNLSDATRKHLETKKNPVMRLEAGYVGSISQIYLGQIRTVHTTIEGANTATEFSSGDGEAAMQKGRINAGIGPKTSPDVVLRQIAKQLDLKPGNLEQAIAVLKSKGLTTLYASGTVLSGNAAQSMTDFCRSAGLEWSVQDGAIQILGRGKALDTANAILISTHTGMVGSPDINSKNKLSVKTLITPGLLPGTRIQVESKLVQGFFRIESVDYTGETFSKPWYCDIVGGKY